MNQGTARYNKLVGEHKKKLFSGLSGRVLEIGPGTGANLPFYPEAVQLIALEPNLHMQKYLEDNAKNFDRYIEIYTGVAERIPLPDESMDTVICTLVLCSVEDVQQSLSEILRVLKPGGTFLFIEHVAAPENTWLHSFQNWITPCWKRLVDGCHPNRHTGKIIQTSGFTDIQIEHLRLELPIVSPHIIGSAAKPR